MKAMIFAAGMGTRMRPLTNTRPKALIEVGGISLLELNIRRLVHHGFRDIVINVHHHAEQIELFIMENAERLGARIVTSDERDLLLDTGGGLRQAQWFFDDRPFLICNADILGNIDLKKLYETHLQNEQQHQTIATFAIQQRDTSRYMLFDQDLTLHGWLNTNTKAIRLARGGAATLSMYSFSCFQVLSPRIFADLNAMKPNVFSMIDVYLHLAERYKNPAVKGYFHPNDAWCDVGKPESIAEAEKLLPLLTHF
jgi:NDP-sugar pyrophosphorylase family protein